jgi:CDP-diacylglycerol--glycerol-3-phosphate 3-phosphatidyltransferase
MALIPLFVYFLLVPSQTNKIMAASIFAALVFTDAVDGFVARKFNAVTTFGKYIDPLADKVLVITALIGLVELRTVSSVPVMIIVAREFAVTAWRLAAANKGIVIAADIFGKWKTAAQMLAVLFLILSWPYGNTLLWISVVLTVYSGAEYIIRTWKGVFE